MKFRAPLLFISALFASPALAEAPPRLQYLEQQLASISAANPGNLGFAALDLETGEFVGINGDSPFPMASTIKVAIAANYLAQVEHGRRTLYDTISGRRADRLNIIFMPDRFVRHDFQTARFAQLVLKLLARTGDRVFVDV